MRTASLLVAFVIFCAPAVAAAQQAQVRMTASAAEVPAGGNVTIEIRAEVSGAPDAGDVRVPQLSGFTIVAQQTSRPIQFSFGFGGSPQVQATTVVQLRLRADVPGKHEIAPATVIVGGSTYASNPLTIVVTGSGVAGGNTTAYPDTGVVSGIPPGLDGAQFDPEAFLRTVVTPRDPLLGEQMTVSVYLYTRSLRGRTLRPPTTDGFWTQDLLGQVGQPESVIEVQGSVFHVQLVHRFAAFPLRTGRLTIGPANVDLEQTSIFNPFQGPALVTRQGVPIEVDVRPLPPAAAQSPVVGAFSIDARIDRSETRPGEAITLTAMVRGRGNLQTIRLPLPAIDGVRAMAPRIQDRLDTNGGIVGGERTFEWLLIPERAGRFTVPAFVLDVVDPASESVARVTSAPIAIEARGPAVETPAAAEEPAPTTDEEAGVIGPLRVRSELRRAAPPLASSPFVILGIVAPLVFAASIEVGRALAKRLAARRRASDTADRRAKDRLSEARRAARALDAQKFYGSITAALHHTLEDTLREPTSGLARDALRARLRDARLADALVADVLDELESAEFARFSAAAADQAEMEHCVDRIADLVRRLRKESA